jgi:hypothetical protein
VFCGVPAFPHNTPRTSLPRIVGCPQRVLRLRGRLRPRASPDMSGAMPQDHYVAQTYLEKWCDPANRDHMHVYRKSDLKHFPARPYDVCREKDGDKTPGYLADESALGKFRARFEPTWNKAIEAAARGAITAEEKFFISGYWANLTATTPTTQALGAALYKREVESLAAAIRKDFPPPESVAHIDIEAEIDPLYVKAVGTQSLLSGAWQFYNQSWVIVSDDTLHPFITSDNPSALIPAPQGMPSLRCLPLTPHLCIIAEMKTHAAVPDTPDLSHLTQPPMGVIQHGRADSDQAWKINRAIAVTALDLVFSSKADAGIARLVAKYRHDGVRLRHRAFTAATGELFTDHSTYLGKQP